MMGVARDMALAARGTRYGGIFPQAGGHPKGGCHAGGGPRRSRNSG